VYEPFGELTSIVTPGTRAAPNGYARSIGYSSAQQGGADFGLPTSVVGTAFPQNDSAVPIRAPSQSYTYDANGNIVCYGNAVGTYALQYDTMSRRTAVADPDDGSGWCGNAPSTSRTASYTAYFPDGSVMFTETPAQHAASAAAPGSAGHNFTYDLDGNPLTEAFPSPSGSGTTTFQSWYDGVDRVVEVQHGITTRYLYDLSQGGSVSVTSSGPFPAYGNLYAKLIRMGTQGNSWTEQGATAFDALDRSVRTFRYAYNCASCAALNSASLVYDDPASGLGMLANVTDETGIKTSYAYDALGRQVGVAFSGDGGVTPARQFTYDAAGNVLTRTSSASGTEQFLYDADGSVLQRTEGSGLTSPAAYLYSYYPDGTKSALTFQSVALSGSTSYVYRNDGRRSALGTSWNGQSAALSWTYTVAGRELAQNDSWASKTMSYDSTGRLASLTIPAGAFTGLQYDNEGDTVGVTAYGFTTVRTYDATHQLLQDHDSPLGCPASEAFKPNWSTYTYANGAQSAAMTISMTCADNATTGSRTTFGNDPHSGAVGTQYTASVEPSPPPKFAGSCSNMPVPSKTTTYTYDAAGRQLTSTTLNKIYAWTGTCMWDMRTSTTSSASAYDAEGHELQYTVTPWNYPPSVADSMQWGVNGHPAVVTLQGQTLSLHWEGDDLLFATTPSGALEQYNVEQSIVAQSGSSPIVTDRDMSGMRVSEHGPTGTDGMCRQNVYGYGTPIKCGQTAGNLGVVLYDRVDGLDIGHGMVQGRRTYDATMAQWTVPDAYDGDVDDPASQQPYMWNRNSPYEYDDPSGYDACLAGQAWNGEDCIADLKHIGSTKSRASAGSQLMPNGETVAQAIARQNRTIYGIETAAAIVGLPIDAEGALAAAGASRITNVHHIVAKFAWRARPARVQLAKYGLSVHDAENLVTLDKSFHSHLHTNGYYDAVNEGLSTAQNASQVRAVLQDLANALQQGWSPR
jgi:YD repeat-containing protein